MAQRRGIDDLRPAAGHSWPHNSSRSRLMSTAEGGSAARIIKLIDEDKADATLANELGLTALHLASSAEAVRALIERGASINALAKRHEHALSSITPFYAAAMLDHDDAVREFVARGADLNAGGPIKMCPMIDNPNKMRALAAFIELGANLSGLLHESILRRQMAPLRMLVDGGADLAELSGFTGETPLAMAIRYKNDRGLNEFYAKAEAYLRSRGAPL